MSPPQTSDISSGGSPPSTGQQALGAAGLDDDVIPTAIVIKNIPFNVKRETLLDIIVSFWPSCPVVAIPALVWPSCALLR